MNDPELAEWYRRAAEADARDDVKWAAADVARTYDLSEDASLYIARVIEGEMRRFERRPRKETGLDREPLVPRPQGPVGGPLTMSRDDLRDLADEADASDGAKAAAVLLVGAYHQAMLDHYRRRPHRLPGVVGTFGPSDHPILYGQRIVEVAELIQQHLDRPDQSQQALATINAHRRALGMPLLDPAAAGWTPEDVLLEAQRIARLPNPLAVAPADPVLAQMSAVLEAALLDDDLDAVDDVLADASEFYGPDARETRALHILVRSYGVLANPSVAELKRRLMP